MIGSDNEKTNLEIVNSICNYFDDKYPSEDNFTYHSLIDFVKDRPGHDFRYSIDNSKIKNKLGWKPEYSFKEALENTIDWYCNNKEWYDKLLNKDYNLDRLGIIKK